MPSSTPKKRLWAFLSRSPAQLTVMTRPSRWLLTCTASATAFFSVPVSPSMMSRHFGIEAACLIIVRRS